MPPNFDWAGFALAITATGGAIGLIINAVKTSKKVDKVLDLTVGIDKAVNQKTPGQQTIAQEVSDLHDDRPGNG